MLQTKSRAVAELQAMIRELESTPDALVGSDERTHRERRIFKLFERIDGSRYAVEYQWSKEVGTIPIEVALEQTCGRIIGCAPNVRAMAERRARLARLKQHLAEVR